MIYQWASSKDLVLAIEIGTAGGNGHVIEYASKAIRDLSMEARMTICNMSIEAGARAGLIAPDETTFNYLRGKPMAPRDEAWDKAVAYWQTLPSDEGAHYDTEVEILAERIAPQVTWGTNPQMVAPITDCVPDPEMDSDPAAARRALIIWAWSGLPSMVCPLTRCLLARARTGASRTLGAGRNHAWSQSEERNRRNGGSGISLVKMQAEEEGIISALAERGFDVREPGCSMCLGMNADQLHRARGALPLRIAISKAGKDAEVARTR